METEASVSQRCQGGIKSEYSAELEEIGAVSADSLGDLRNVLESLRLQ